MHSGKERETYIVATIMVGITRSGMISKMTRTSNQAVGLYKARRNQMYRQARANIKAMQTEIRTYSTRLSVRARTVGVLPAHYGARSKTRALSKNPIQSSDFERRGQVQRDRRTRKKRTPTRDWNPAMLSPVWKYSPPTNTPSSTDITIWARKNVLSLNSNQ